VLLTSSGIFAASSVQGLALHAIQGSRPPRFVLNHVLNGPQFDAIKGPL